MLPTFSHQSSLPLRFPISPHFPPGLTYLHGHETGPPVAGSRVRSLLHWRRTREQSGPSGDPSLSN